MKPNQGRRRGDGIVPSKTDHRERTTYNGPPRGRVRPRRSPAERHPATLGHSNRDTTSCLRHEVPVNRTFRHFGIRATCLEHADSQLPCRDERQTRTPASAVRSQPHPFATAARWAQPAFRPRARSIAALTMCSLIPSTWTSLSGDVAPKTTLTSEGRTPTSRANNRHSARFAFPSTGGAATRASRTPSRTPRISSRPARA